MNYYDTYDWRQEYCLDHKPEEIETDSSYYVWLRKDFKEVDGHWEYMERKITIAQYLAEQQKLNRETNDALMLGLVDLYELQIGEI